MLDARHPDPSRSARCAHAGKLRPAQVYLDSSRSSTGCHDYNCGVWGPSKLVDAGPPDLTSLALALPGVNPFWQLDLGRPRAGILAVSLLHGPWDWGADAFQDLNVTLSNTTDPASPTDSVLCAARIRFTTPGTKVVVSCPPGVVARYVSVIKSGVSALPLWEMQPLEAADGAPQSTTPLPPAPPAAIGAWTHGRARRSMRVYMETT